MKVIKIVHASLNIYFTSNVTTGWLNTSFHHYTKTSLSDPENISVVAAQVSVNSTRKAVETLFVGDLRACVTSQKWHKQATQTGHPSFQSLLFSGLHKGVNSPGSAEHKLGGSKGCCYCSSEDRFGDNMQV